jgi:hypothetical protein
MIIEIYLTVSITNIFFLKSKIEKYLMELIWISKELKIYIKVIYRNICQFNGLLNFLLGISFNFIYVV